MRSDQKNRTCLHHCRKHLARFTVLVLALYLPLTALLSALPAPEHPRFRFAFSTTILGELNESDARAAMKVWAQTLVNERHIDVEGEPRLVRGTRTIIEGLLDHSIDAAAMTTPEYFEVSREVKLGEHVFGSFQGKIDEEYLLLVHKDGGISQLSDLADRSLVVFQSARTSVAEAWLDIALSRKDLGPAAETLRKITYQSKLARAILPVFFRQADACLVHARGFRLMGEMNPQVLSQLKPLITSPLVVPQLLGFRADYRLPNKGQLLEGLLQMHTSPGGQQILTLFQSDRVILGSSANVQGALDILKSRERLSAGRWRGAKPGVRPGNS